MSTNTRVSEPVPFTQVHTDELRLLRPTQDDTPPAPADAHLVGLALSGGGIRSATFSLGLLQGLAKSSVLRRFDYVSGVSGGAYIGAWLTAWIHRMTAPKPGKVLDPIAEAERTLAGGSSQARAPEAPAIHHLREYSNYLTPRPGLFSADTWTFIGGFLANLALNLLVVVIAMATLLALFRLHTHYFDDVSGSSPVQLRFLIAAILLLYVALTYQWINAQSLLLRMEESTHGVRSGPRYGRPSWVNHIHWAVVVPILASAWLVSIWLLTMRNQPLSSGIWTGKVALLYAFTCTLAWWTATFARVFLFPREDLPDNRGSVLFGPRSRRFGSALRQVRGVMTAYFATSIAAGALGGILLLMIAKYLPESAHALWCLPLVILVYVVADLAHTGLTGSGLSAEVREWRVRLGASLLRFGTVLALLAAVRYVSQERLVTIDDIGVFGAVWLSLMAFAYVLGRTAALTETTAHLGAGLVTCAAVLFVVGVVAVLIVLAEGTVQFLAKVAMAGWRGGESFHVLGTLLLIGGAGSAWLSVSSRRSWVRVLGLALLGIATWYLWSVLGAGCAVDEVAGYLVTVLVTASLTFVLAWRIDINEFSAHGLYKSRLSRCYLGATNRERQANPFTDFDVEDDQIQLGDVGKAGAHKPYPIFNAALNLLRGDQLAWQDRMATSFTFTPLYSGYQRAFAGSESGGESETEGEGRSAYQRTAECGDKLTLGTVIAISGAAVSPSMGFYSSGARAFLLTVFNMRLGRWLGNPRWASAWESVGPRFGLGCLGREVLGLTNDGGPWVYLSDGGHFEVLGVYELLRRRCSRILVSDATADPDFRFDGLLNLVRRARTDLGVDIEVGDLSAIRPREESGNSAAHYCKMKVAYPEGQTGELIYVKASITGDEPVELMDARRTQRGFPHQSTRDQFFSEEQFESYRQLGFHIGVVVSRNTLGGAGPTASRG